MLRIRIRFLYADPTPNALQVFLPGKPDDNSATDTAGSNLPSEQGAEVGTWIVADPIPGCVVCNIGESTFLLLLYVIKSLMTHIQCGRSGPMDSIARRFIGSFIAPRTIVYRECTSSVPPTIADLIEAFRSFTSPISRRMSNRWRLLCAF